MQNHNLTVFGLLLALPLLLAACNDDDNTTTPSRTTSGTTSGTTAGTTSGTTSGTTAGTTGTAAQNSFSVGTTVVNNVTTGCMASAPTNAYIITGYTNAGASANIYLGGGVPTASGTYTLVTDTPQPGQAIAMINLDTSGNNSFVTTGGHVTITLVGGKVQASFSNAPVMNFMSSATATASANLSCP